MRTHLTLDVLEVKNPCAAEWEAMFGDGKVRFCEHCQKNVHNLSAMSAKEAEHLVCKSAGNLCVRYACAADGSVISLEYRRQKTRRWTWRVWTVIALAGALTTGAVEAIFLGKRIPLAVPTPPPPPPYRMVLGEIAPGPAPTPAAPQPATPGAAAPTP